MSRKPKTAAEIVGELETILAGNPDSFDQYGLLIINCVKSNARPRALNLIGLGKTFMASHKMSILRKYEFANSLFSVWKMEKFSKKTADSIKINDTAERKQYLLDAHEIFANLPPTDDINLQHEIMLAFASVKESLGLLTESLAILSDLITAEADEGVELAYVIFKAAVILKRLGQTGQALEYLEFLQDDPPQRSAITRAHILALLTLTFDQGGNKYAVVLQNTYPQLKEAYLEDIQNGPNPEATLVKVEKQFKQKPIEVSSEIWEVLSLQMLERSETAFCAELFHQVRNQQNPHVALILYLINCDAGDTEGSEQSLCALHLCRDGVDTE
jgi:tetratricopeptide (TPR) repeat protein